MKVTEKIITGENAATSVEPEKSSSATKSSDQSSKEAKAVAARQEATRLKQEEESIKQRQKEHEENISEAKMNMWRANQLEAAGDNLYSRGSLFYAEALAKYKEVQNLYPSGRVQQKIDEINAVYLIAELIDDASDRVDQLAYDLDSDEKTRRVYGFVKYVGLYSNLSELSPSNQPPIKGVSIGLSGSRLFMTMEFRASYMKSPVLEYIIRDGSYQDYSYNSYYLSYDNKRVEVQNDLLMGGVSLGVNIPLKPIMIYATYGYDMGDPIKSHIITEGYMMEDNAEYPLFSRKITIGSVIKIPKTALSVGINYDFISAKGIEESPYRIKHESSPEFIMYLDSTSDTNIKFGVLSVGLFFGAN